MLSIQINNVYWYLIGHRDAACRKFIPWEFLSRGRCNAAFLPIGYLHLLEYQKQTTTLNK
jgi:hypothetical protein